MSTVYEFREKIKTKLMEKLYSKQLAHWNSALIALSIENARSQDRVISAKLPWEYSIYYRDKKWCPEFLDWTDNSESVYCIQLNPAYPDFETRMERIADELTDIREERYEAERFLSGVVLFNAPPEPYKRILGSTLYAVIASELKSHHYTIRSPDYSPNAEYGLIQFARKNISIVKAMNERLMMNLISLPA